MIKILVDVYGGDNAPHEIVKGCVEAINNDNEISLVLVGKENEINTELSKYKYSQSQIQIVNADDVFLNSDTPTDILKSKKTSSMYVSFEQLKADSTILGMISAGNTGALLTGGIFKIGRIAGVMRPSLIAVMPTIDKKEVCIIDTGANVDCTPEYLAQFAIMGSAYMQAMFGIQSPRVALLSNGVEDKKGNSLTTQAFSLLKKLPIKFVGNMEARDALSGDYDVLVCDGFDGNILLKGIEGAAKMVMKTVKNAIMSSKKAKIGYALFMKNAFKSVKSDMDYSTKGGAPFLGIEKILVKAHGSSNATAIASTIKQVKHMAQNNLIDNIKSRIENINSEGEQK